MENLSENLPIYPQVHGEVLHLCPADGEIIHLLLY